MASYHWPSCVYPLRSPSSFSPLTDKYIQKRLRASWPLSVEHRLSSSLITPSQLDELILRTPLSFPISYWKIGKLQTLGVDRQLFFLSLRGFVSLCIFFLSLVTPVNSIFASFIEKKFHRRFMKNDITHLFCFFFFFFFSGMAGATRRLITESERVAVIFLLFYPSTYFFFYIK